MGIGSSLLELEMRVFFDLVVFFLGIDLGDVFVWVFIVCRRGFRKYCWE